MTSFSRGLWLLRKGFGAEARGMGWEEETIGILEDEVKGVWAEELGGSREGKD